MVTTVEDHLQAFRAQHGDEAWKAEVCRLAKEAIRISPKHEAFWKELTEGYDWLNWEELRRASIAETGTPDPERMMAEMLRKQMPGIKSQAQYNAVVGALDAVRLVLNAILEGKRDQEADGRKALEMAFEITSKSTEITSKLEEVPEAATSKSAEAFRTPPTQFSEYDVLKQLLAELGQITVLRDLTSWYDNTKDRRDKVVTQGLRNTLMDAIRTKKVSL